MRPEPPATRRRWLHAIAAATIVSAVYAVYAPAHRNGFLVFDDAVMITRNVAFRGLGAENLRWMFTSFTGGHWQPLAWLTLAADHALWGMAPGGYHATNVAIHALNGLLVYLLAMTVLARVRAGAPAVDLCATAAAAALVWSLHPLRVEPVAWVTERRDLVSGTLYLASLVAYVRAHERPIVRRGWLAASIACMAGSLLAKAWAVTLPAVLLVLDWYPLRRCSDVPWTCLVREKIAWVAVAAIGILTTAASFGASGAVYSLDVHPPSARIAQAAYGLVFYVWKSLVPLGLVPLYEMRGVPSPLEPRYAAAIVVVIVMAVGLLRWRTAVPAALAAGLAYVAILSPVLGTVQAGPQLVADRYSYLAAVPLCLLAAGTIERALTRAPRLRLGVACLTVAALVVLGTLAHRLVAVWENDATLWRHTLAVDPENAFARYSLGFALQDAGDSDGARAQYAALESLARQRPDDGDVRGYLGLAQARLGQAERRAGRPAEAIEYFERAIALNPGSGAIRVDLGAAYLETGRVSDAMAQWDRAFELAPDDAQVRNELAGALIAAERFAEAETMLRAALRLRPDDAGLYVNLAVTQWNQGRHADAVQSVEHALRLDPAHPDAGPLLQRLQAAMAAEPHRPSDGGR